MSAWAWAQQGEATKTHSTASQSATAPPAHSVPPPFTPAAAPPCARSGASLTRLPCTPGRRQCRAGPATGSRPRATPRTRGARGRALGGRAERAGRGRRGTEQRTGCAGSWRGVLDVKTRWRKRRRARRGKASERAHLRHERRDGPTLRHARYLPGDDLLQLLPRHEVCAAGSSASAPTAATGAQEERNADAHSTPSPAGGRASRQSVSLSHPS